MTHIGLLFQLKKRRFWPIEVSAVIRNCDNYIVLAAVHEAFPTYPHLQMLIKYSFHFNFLHDLLMNLINIYKDDVEYQRNSRVLNITGDRAISEVTEEYLLLLEVSRIFLVEMASFMFLSQ